MADTNEQNRDDGNGEICEKDNFVLSVEDPKYKNHYNDKKSISRLLWAIFVCAIVCLVMIICMLPDLQSFHYYFSKPSGSSVSSLKTSDKTQERTCAYNTDLEYWESLPDDLTEYCTPKKVIDGSSSYVIKHYQCPGTELFIPLLCLCDYNVTCPSVNSNTESQTDHYRKRTCKLCTNEDHCPCQNSGICKKCTRLRTTAQSLECKCKKGTNGTYCTKITVRLCNRSEELNGLENCNNSNNLECFLRLSNRETYICKWKETMNGVYPICGLSVSAMKGGMPNSEGTRNSEAPQLTTAYIVVWPTFLLLVVIVVLVAILIFYGRCQTFVKKCRKKKS
ncbi:uncharacterized protein LOC127708950 isoform X1 [Mytilus californianus]|uniref:uncharacterized protein LOC127708950 isoform X1 n=1 Tax=Mytilus californianus TaxID=6549 RepID=UPI0022479B87|nr:uncharacterized protein LOC127708950 isoform X1 [Mytilus californianus]XP_052070115.1 uncharacterized protein LOC127708950 isoform X1 [Mytilus californianus]XP_052070116.1 uncharacterized protein LOC127708950 isoform X1 [Mytilus californianus]XP_052070117.1 uncharacterized protein LOC127708950 isoform X1 [Mytilus californianus]XP_052070118.1 uncharacterized protein LOC127708950 isoform X1 [Mytilus californianus]XP_052070119.1 uncharacterized protein LOC127708950 isoform X1 [Mytilus californ